MEKPLRIVLQESDDGIRSYLTKVIEADSRFVLMRSYKSFHAMLLTEPVEAEVDIVLINWQYPYTLLNKLNTSKNNTRPSYIVTFDFVQPDFLICLEKINIRFFLIKPFLTDDLLQLQHFLAEHPFLQYHAENLRLMGT